MDYETLAIEEREDITTVILNRPAKLNALTRKARLELLDFALKMREDLDTRFLSLGMRSEQVGQHSSSGKAPGSLDTSPLLLGLHVRALRIGGPAGRGGRAQTSVCRITSHKKAVVGLDKALAAALE